jgi:hypothetical protein
MSMLTVDIYDLEEKDDAFFGGFPIQVRFVLRHNSFSADFGHHSIPA